MDVTFDPTKIRAIIGLGNPGSKYSKNRHNIGFRVVDQLVAQHYGSWQKSDLMEYTTINISNQSGSCRDVFVIKPLTFMNSSGKVLPWLTKKGIKPDQILVVHDELEKNFGQLVLKLSGSHKGHNGLRSIMEMIGPDFWRLKFGISRPADRNEVPDYVLADFARAEEEQIGQLIDKALGLLL